MPATFHPDCVDKGADGVLCVNNVSYPMAESCLATEFDIQQAIKRTAKVIAKDYSVVQQVVNGTPSMVASAEKKSCSDPGTSSDVKEPISFSNPLICLCVLKGSSVFGSDMVRALNDEGLALVWDFIRISSYGRSTTSSGRVTLIHPPMFTALRGKHLLILEDVFDSGYSMKWLLQYLQDTYSPASIKVCVLASKPKEEARKVDIQEPEYVCLHVPNKWVIGYGFEVNDRYRNFRHVFSLKKGEGKRFPAKL